MGTVLRAVTTLPKQQRGGDTGSLLMLSVETCQILKTADSWPRGLFSIHSGVQKNVMQSIRYCCSKPDGFIYTQPGLQSYILTVQRG